MGRAHEVRGHYALDLHVEVPADLTLGQARLPEINQVLVPVEPEGEA